MDDNLLYFVSREKLLLLFVSPKVKLIYYYWVYAVIGNISCIRIIRHEGISRISLCYLYYLSHQSLIRLPLIL